MEWYPRQYSYKELMLKILPLSRCSFKNNINGFSGVANPFEKITSHTAHSLYNTDFPYSEKNIGQDYFPTFVQTEATGKPVEVYVKPLYILDGYEEFEIYKQNNNKMILLGMRSYDIDRDANIIVPGFMRTYKKGLKGIGFRLNQITFERMLMKNCKNIKLLSTVEAYDFHNCMGYTGSKNSGILTLSNLAKRDWFRIAQRQPILLGKLKI